MLANGVSHLNGHDNGVNGHTLVCASDYPAVEIDVTPHQPQPKWQDQFPQFTHNLSWQDSDGISHSMTLRSDSLQALMADLKLLKGMIKAAKEQHSTANPTQSQTQEECVACKVHGVEMERRISKRTGGHYFSHKLSDRELCFGRPKA